MLCLHSVVLLLMGKVIPPTAAILRVTDLFWAIRYEGEHKKGTSKKEILQLSLSQLTLTDTSEIPRWTCPPFNGSNLFYKENMIDCSSVQF